MSVNKTKTVKYFSAFSGIGGFELGILQAYETSIKSKELQGQNLCPGEDSNRIESRVGQQQHASVGLPTYKKMGRLQQGVQKSTSGGNAKSERSRPQCVGFSEIDKYAIQIYQSHFPEHKNYGDITKIATDSIPDFDLLCGGFPCQAFSIAGKRAGFDDTRGTLFFELAKIARVKKPRLLLFENVKGLLSHDGGRTFKTIIRTLDELGYGVQWQVLNSKNFGVPQNRERVFIVGHLRGTARPKIFPIAENYSEDIILPTITTRITADSNGTYVSQRQTQKNLKYIGAVMSEKNKQWLKDGKTLSRNFPQGQRIYDPNGISSTLSSQGGGLGAKTGLYAIKTVRTEETKRIRRESMKKGKDWGPRQGYELAARTDELMNTITANWEINQSVTDGAKIRRLTPVECERLQGFPDWWTANVSDTQRYKTLGNAVTVNVIQEIIKRLLYRVRI